MIESYVLEIDIGSEIADIVGENNLRILSFQTQIGVCKQCRSGSKLVVIPSHLLDTLLYCKTKLFTF